MSYYLISYEFRLALGLLVVFWAIGGYYFWVDNVMADMYCRWLTDHPNESDQVKAFMVQFTHRLPRRSLVVILLLAFTGVYFIDLGGTYVTFALAVVSTIKYATSVPRNLKAKRHVYHTHLTTANRLQAKQ